MKCPCCGAAELVHDTRDIPFTYKGESTSIPEVTGDFCPACAEVILNQEQGDRYSELMGQFQRQVDAAFVTPAYIATVRKKLDLNQNQAIFYTAQPSLHTITLSHFVS
jgi:HTH-type transcriptional regulator/antitoxin MqsA